MACSKLGSWIISILAFLVACAGLCAQPSSCESLQPLEASPYQYRDRGNRCEGLYIAEYGARKIELVSLTQAPIRFRLRPGANLHVSAVPEFGPIHVRAVAKPVRTPYRMDAILQPRETLMWPVSDVLLPQSITAARIGVFGWKGNGDDRVYVPVRITSEGEPLSTALTDSIVLSIRPTFDTTFLQWRWAARTGSVCGSFNKWIDASSTTVDADESVDIKLTGLRGRSCVQVAAQSLHGGQWATADLNLEVPDQ